jgi:hypothetical protein
MFDTSRVDKYLSLTDWARRRYVVNGKGLVVIERGKPTRYSEIERMAWTKYLA